MNGKVVALALWLFPATVLAQTSAPSPPQSVVASPGPAQAASAAAAKAITTAGIPGAAVLAIDRGQVVLNAAYGVSNTTTKTPVQTSTRFEIGSITKQFTAAAVLQLRERGKLSLDDRLGKYVPQYTKAANVTIRQLLWQVSGIPNYTDVPHFDRIVTTQPGGFANILALIRNKPLDFTPGTKWEYSNSNYVILGHIVELVSGATWNHYIRAHIFVPAGMTDSSFMEDEAHTSGLATGYGPKKGALAAQPTFINWAIGAGAIVSTTGDLARWNAALFGGKLISQADVTLMTTSGKLKNGDLTRYGFGWIADTHDGQQRFWHNGGTFGFSAANHVYPRLDQQIIVLTNDAGADADIVANNVFAALNPQFAAAENTPVAGEDPAITARVKEWIHRFQTGDIDRTQFTPEMNKAITPQLADAVKTQFSSLGDPTSVIYRGKQTARGLTLYTYRATFASGITLNIFMSLDASGKIAGYVFRPG